MLFLSFLLLRSNFVNLASWSVTIETLEMKDAEVESPEDETPWVDDDSGGCTIWKTGLPLFFLEDKSDFLISSKQLLFPDDEDQDDG